MRALILAVLLFMPGVVFSGVIPEKSRIVFNGKNTIQSYVLVNTNQYPVVVQLWIDDGKFNHHPELTPTPFVITPAMLKMEPSKINEIKIINSEDDFKLPENRESLFWLNMLEVPPVNENNKSENEVTLSMLTQIKVIYRPESMKINEFDFIKKLDDLGFSLRKDNENKLQLVINNPTAYVASLSGVSLSGVVNNKKMTFKPEEIRNLTLLPQRSETYSVDLNDANIQEIEYWVIDDEGKFYHKKRGLTVTH